MKPSERINQIIDKVQSENGWNVLEAGLAAICRYLDEEYEKNQLSDKEASDEKI